MRRLIRNTKTGAFWKDGTWVNDPREAKEFPNIHLLLTICGRHRLKDVEMVVRFGSDGSGQIAVPLGPAVWSDREE